MSRLVATIIAVLLVSTGVAEATPEFPEVIEREVGTAGPPPCAVCHSGGHLSRYSVVTPFGHALRVRGLVAWDEDSLVAALEDVRREEVDSDNDDVGDIAELEGGTDPNIPDAQPGWSGLSYGCVGQVAQGRPGAGAPALVGLLVALGLSRTRRRGRQRTNRGDRIGQGASNAPMLGGTA